MHDSTHTTVGAHRSFICCFSSSTVTCSTEYELICSFSSIPVTVSTTDLCICYFISDTVIFGVTHFSIAVSAAPVRVQAPQLHRLLSEAANALGLERAPHLFLHQSQQAALHYLELPVSTCLPGLAFTTPRQRAAVSAAAAAAVQHADVHSARTSLDSLSDAAVLQPAVVVTSRMIELLQPQELQAMLVGCLSSGIAPGRLPNGSCLAIAC